MKLSEIVREIISMGRAANQARTAEGPEDDSPLVTSGGDTATMKARTAEECRLREFLEAQPPAVVYMLIAMMYLGRGDYDAKDLLDQYADMSEAFGNPKGAARQMLVKLALPEYLEEGLKKLARAGLDADKLLAG
jgi:hypothetical protein